MPVILNNKRKSNVDKKSLKVKFGNTSVSVFDCNGSLNRSANGSSSRGSKPPVKITETWFSTASKSLNLAVKRASTLSKEVGSYQSIKNKISLIEEPRKNIIDNRENDNQDDSSSDDSVEASPAENASRKWIADTGSGHDLIDEKALEGRYEVEPVSTIKFKTAGGTTSTSEKVDVNVSMLGETAEPVLLKGTPAVLSVGKRCMEQSYLIDRFLL